MKIGGKAYPRVRSISMNGNMNGDSWYTALIEAKWWTFRKMSNIQQASQMFVFIDEREESVDDGYLLVGMDDNKTWGNLPAIYHNGAGGLGFADGHAEIRKWLDPRTKPPIRKGRDLELITSSANNVDVAWLQERATGLK